MLMLEREGRGESGRVLLMLEESMERQTYAHDEEEEAVSRLALERLGGRESGGVVLNAGRKGKKRKWHAYAWGGDW